MNSKPTSQTTTAAATEELIVITAWMVLADSTDAFVWDGVAWRARIGGRLKIQIATT